MPLPFPPHKEALPGRSGTQQGSRSWAGFRKLLLQGDAFEETFILGYILDNSRPVFLFYSFPCTEVIRKAHFIHALERIQLVLESNPGQDVFSI